MASVLIYKKTKPNTNTNTKPKANLKSNKLKPNQKYRKRDPQTRYDDDGTRYQCVAIPFRITNNSKVQIFMITSRNRGDYIFPGGGWERNETGPQCAQRGTENLFCLKKRN